LSAEDLQTDLVSGPINSRYNAFDIPANLEIEVPSWMIFSLRQQDPNRHLCSGGWQLYPFP
jgi:hypothetical protein